MNFKFVLIFWIHSGLKNILNGITKHVFCIYLSKAFHIITSLWCRFKHGAVYFKSDWKEDSLIRVQNCHPWIFKFSLRIDGKKITPTPSFGPKTTETYFHFVISRRFIKKCEKSRRASFESLLVSIGSSLRYGLESGAITIASNIAIFYSILYFYWVFACVCVIHEALAERKPFEPKLVDKCLPVQRFQRWFWCTLYIRIRIGLVCLVSWKIALFLQPDVEGGNA